MDIPEWTYNNFGNTESADDRFLKLMKALAERQEELLERKRSFIEEYREMREGSGKKNLK